MINMEGVSIAGNGFRTIGAIAALQEDLSRPVPTGNQVAFRYALRLAGVRSAISHSGRIEREACEMVTIREASAYDRDAVWDIFHAVIALGDTYVFEPEMPR